MREYDLQRALNAHLQKAQIEEVYNEVPEIIKIEDAISTISVQQARKLLEGDENALPELKVQLKQLSDKKKQLLKENHFPEDYMEPIYTCPYCKDTGFIDNEKCSCFIQASLNLLYSQSDLRRLLEEENFNTFRLDYYSDTLTDSVTGLTSYQAITRAVEESKDFIRKFSYEYQNLLFYGSTGIGKTFLTHCIAKEILDASHSVLYFSSAQLFEALAEIAFEKTEQVSRSLQENIYNCDLLIIDDLGTEMTNAFVASSLFSILDERDKHRKSTIISTNLSLHNIRDTYSDRIFSRVSSKYKIIKLFGDDIRLLKKLQNY